MCMQIIYRNQSIVPGCVRNDRVEDDVTVDRLPCSNIKALEQKCNEGM